MKRTARHPIGAFLLQVTSIRLNDPHQISPVFQVVNEILVVEHESVKISYDRRERLSVDLRKKPVFSFRFDAVRIRLSRDHLEDSDTVTRD